MSDSFGLVILIIAAWLTIGLMLSVLMGRRGHNSFGWLVLGAVFGPLGVVLAVDAWRHAERLAPVPASDVLPQVGAGPVDVLVGYDGSPESGAAIDAAVALLGDRIGRLTVATVVNYGSVPGDERMARQALRRLAARVPARPSAFEVLHGHPSAALTQYAIEGGYELIAVGARGKGVSRAVYGSAASELARDGKIPTLVVGAPAE